MAGRDTGGWRAPPAALALAPDEVHVWRVDLDRAAADLDGLASTLSDDERVRAARFRLDAHRRHFVAARGFLRRLLARYLAASPADLHFEYGPQGKPSLVGQALRFNLSHSRGLALYAVTTDRAVGVDVERLRDDVAVAALAARFFAPAEQALLEACDGEARRRAFFRLWTCKEAYLKATGTGVTRLLREVVVTLAPEVRLTIRGEPSGRPRWSLRELAPGADHVAALVVEGDGWRLGSWDGTP